MSVYEKEKAEHLCQSVQSMLKQTVAPTDFVIVCDGPLTPALDEVLNEFEQQHPRLFHLLRLPQNEGLGSALQKGLQLCRHELVARMDSDDISAPNRCVLQLEAFAKDPRLAVVGGQITEFAYDYKRPYALRTVPLTAPEIHRYSKRRNPFNHMTVMLRKAAVLDAGNYQPFPLFEDYYLWMRMLKQGAKTCNLPKVLVSARVGDGMIARRGGFGYAKKQLCFLTALYKEGLISPPWYLLGCVVRTVSGVMPISLRTVLYRTFLRSSGKTSATVPYNCE